MSSLPGNKSLEELEKLALTEVSSPRQAADPILLFLSTFDILPGKHPVRSVLLYDLFNAWAGYKFPGGVQAFALKLMPLLPKCKKGFSVSRSSTYLASVLGRKKAASSAPTKDLGIIEKFFEKYEVARGNFWLEAEALYYLFMRDDKGKDLGVLRFTRAAMLLLDNRTTSDGKVWLRVSDSIGKFLSEKELSELRMGWKRRDERKAKAQQKVS